MQPQLLPQGSSLLLAVSGGQDSMALLALLQDLAPLHGWGLSLWHGDHRWHRGSSQIAAELNSWCEQRQLPLQVDQAAPGHVPSEAKARQWRYERLEQRGREAGADVVTGHTASDRAETMLLQLARGSDLGRPGGPAQRPPPQPGRPPAAPATAAPPARGHPPDLPGAGAADLGGPQQPIPRVRPQPDSPGGAAGAGGVASRQHAADERSGRTGVPSAGQSDGTQPDGPGASANPSWPGPPRPGGVELSHPPPAAGAVAAAAGGASPAGQPTGRAQPATGKRCPRRCSRSCRGLATQLEGEGSWCCSSAKQSINRRGHQTRSTPAALQTDLGQTAGRQMLLAFGHPHKTHRHSDHQAGDWGSGGHLLQQHLEGGWRTADQHHWSR